MLFSWLYVITNALSALLRQISIHHVSPILILFGGSLMAVLFFNSVNLSQLKTIYQQCFQYKKDWFLMSCATCVIWFCAVYGPGYLGASLYLFIFFNILGVLGLSSVFLKKSSRDLSHLISILGTAGLLLYLSFLSLSHHLTTQKLIGLGIALLGGSITFIYFTQSEKFMKKTSFTSSQILAVRSYLTIGLSMIALPPNAVENLNLLNSSLITLIALFSFILPLYFSQRAIGTIGAELNAIIVSSTPFCTGILEQVCFHDVPRSYFIIYLTYSFFLSLPYLAKRLRRKTNKSYFNAYS